MNNYKIPTNLDLDALRAFVKGIELGSFHLAAEQLCRSPAAISAQLKKLEQQTQCQLLRKKGRLLELTPNGELLLRVAKELLAKNDHVLLQLQQNQQDGYIRFGLQEDFAEGLLQEVIAQFMQQYPNVQFHVQVDRNLKLIEKIHRQELDLALIWQQKNLFEDQFKTLKNINLHWLYCAHPHIEALFENKKSIPLVVLQQPCILRQIAIELLDQHQIAWHIAYKCNSVFALWAAIRAGMGVSLRSPINTPQDIQTLASHYLPSLPSLNYGMYLNIQPTSSIIENFQRHLHENLLIFKK